MTKENQLEQVLTATNTLKMLGFLLSHPNEELYDRELSRLTGISPAGTNLSLRELAEIGLIEQLQKGRMKFYRLTLDDPLIRQMKIVKNLSALSSLAEGLKSSSIRIVLFGSAASGEDTKASDIDLFVLTHNKENALNINVKDRLAERLKPMICTPSEWADISAKNEVLKKEVERGIVLWDEILNKDSRKP